ncbi:MAG: helix-turn-helix domain-containing protein [Gemmatimonadaceae bacterium]|nr:helix-turn-helix domain-containing protein [Gemmatimonadaceae bacterium]
MVSIPRSVSAPDFQELLDLRAEFPLVAMIGLFIAKESDLAALARLAAAGVADVLPVEQPSIAHHVRSTLSRAQAESLSSRVWRLAAVNVTDSAASLLRPALRLAHSPISLPVLANAVRMHERSVRKYCHANALPSPQWIIGWARSLLVAYYLEESGRSIQSIATLLGYKSSSLLANHLKRYTGKTASVLREESPLRTVGRLLESALAPPPGSPHRES